MVYNHYLGQKTTVCVQHMTTHLASAHQMILPRFTDAPELSEVEYRHLQACSTQKGQIMQPQRTLKIMPLYNSPLTKSWISRQNYRWCSPAKAAPPLAIHDVISDNISIDFSTSLSDQGRPKSWVCEACTYVLRFVTK